MGIDRIYISPETVFLQIYFLSFFKFCDIYYNSSRVQRVENSILMDYSTQQSFSYSPVVEISRTASTEKSSDWQIIL